MEDTPESPSLNVEWFMVNHDAPQFIGCFKAVEKF